MSTPFFTDTKNVNAFYALDIAIENYFSSHYLNNESSRIIYSSNECALRKRAQTSKTQTLNYPFYNYYLTGAEYTSGRNLYNFDLALHGIDFSQYGGYIYPLVTTFSYESTFFFERRDDAVLTYQKLLWDQAIETLIYPTVQVNINKDTSFNLNYVAVLDFTLQLDPQYKENDWLERNKIHTISVDMSIQSFIFMSEFDFCIPTEILFNFVAGHDADTTDYAEAYHLLIDHVNEVVTNPDDPKDP